MSCLMKRFVLASYLILLSVFVHAETVVVSLYSGGNPPYTIIKNGVPSGIFVDLFQEIEKRTDYTFEFKVLPMARVLVEFDQGHIDIEPGVSEVWRAHTKVPGVYSIAFESSTEVLVSNPESFIKLNQMSDLFGKRVGVVRGYSYPGYDELFEQGKITKVENVSEINLLKQLSINRLNHIFIGYRTILYYQKHFPEYRDFKIGGVVNRAKIRMRVQPAKAHLLNVIDKTLSEMKYSGAIDKVYSKYVL